MLRHVALILAPVAAIISLMQRVSRLYASCRGLRYYAAPASQRYLCRHGLMLCFDFAVAESRYTRMNTTFSRFTPLSLC